MNGAGASPSAMPEPEPLRQHGREAKAGSGGEVDAVESMSSRVSSLGPLVTASASGVANGAELPAGEGRPQRVGKAVEGRPTEVGYVLAALVPALPEQVARDLARLVGHSLAAPAMHAQREARLGLMLDLVSDGTGEFVSVDSYERARAARSREDELWPAHATLISAYGDWLRVVAAAMRLHRDGTRALVSHRVHRKQSNTPYRREDVVRALRQAREALGDWPGEWEYLEYRRVALMLGRDAGRTDLRLPQRAAIRRLFGDYARAMSVAQRDADT